MTKNTVFVSLDIETCVKYCGIMQLSVEMFNIVLSDNPDKKKIQPTLIHLWVTIN